MPASVLFFPSAEGSKVGFLWQHAQLLQFGKSAPELEALVAFLGSGRSLSGRVDDGGLDDLLGRQFNFLVLGLRGVLF
jgi:hypothetical protein